MGSDAAPHSESELAATLAALHDQYEKALVDNDVAALNGFFWDSPHVVRYGVAEQLYGAEELHAYRQGPTPTYTGRRIARRVVTTFGQSFATIMCEVEMLIRGDRRRIRQSQTWVRLPDVGWRIVAAHVSAPLTQASPNAAWAAYTGTMAGQLGLSLDDATRAGVAANLERTAAIAASLLAVAIPDNVEPAFVFRA